MENKLEENNAIDTEMNEDITPYMNYYDDEFDEEIFDEYFSELSKIDSDHENALQWICIFSTFVYMQYI